jgi:hypothetical protein
MYRLKNRMKDRQTYMGQIDGQTCKRKDRLRYKEIKRWMDPQRNRYKSRQMNRQKGIQAESLMDELTER